MCTIQTSHTECLQYLSLSYDDKNNAALNKQKTEVQLKRSYHVRSRIEIFPQGITIVTLNRQQHTPDAII